jgi:hypothetical protein
MKYQALVNRIKNVAQKLYSDSVEIKIVTSMASSEDDIYFSIEWVDGLNTYTTKDFYTIVEAFDEVNRITGLDLKKWDKYKKKD